jgi:anti-sigma factor RsiW
MSSSRATPGGGNVNGERPEAHTLLGPYVMDALDSRERARFERHLTRCQECTTEAGSLREATGRLATATYSQPDAAAKEQVLAELPRTRQLRRSPAGPGLSRGRRRRAR